MDEQHLQRWVTRYVRAWNSNDPAEIGALFADDAQYLRTPFSPPWVGREEIVRGWLEIHDEPGTFTFDWRVLAARPIEDAAGTGALGVVRGLTTYLAAAEHPETVYSNLWVVELDHEGRCRQFTEWWMERPRG